jgi:hypothetical protein
VQPDIDTIEERLHGCRHKTGSPRDAAVQVTVPSLIGPGAELVVKNESDQPIRVIADPHETLKLKVRHRSQ